MVRYSFEVKGSLVGMEVKKSRSQGSGEVVEDPEG